MRFTPIDFNTWPRREMFYYFSKMAPTGYSLTVDVDATLLLKKLKSSSRKFFPTYLWLVTTSLNRQQEFKIAYREGEFGCYDTLTPLYAVFHNDDKTISLMWTEYDEEYSVFYDRYMENQKKYGGNHGLLSQPGSPPPANAYTVSAVPWISFRSFSLQTDNREYFFPSVEAGRIYEADGRMLMPLSVTCHHATTDGYHVNMFLKELQKVMDSIIL